MPGVLRATRVGAGRPTGTAGAPGTVPAAPGLATARGPPLPRSAVSCPDLRSGPRRCLGLGRPGRRLRAPGLPASVCPPRSHRLGVARGERAQDDQDEDVSRGQGAEGRFDAGRDRQTGDDDRELAAGHQRAARAPAALDGDPGPPGRPVAGGDLRRAVSTASARAGSRTGGMLAGSVCSPKKTKKTAANRSRKGLSRVCAPSATSPDSAMPTRKAPTAADTWSCWATPATRIVRPSTTSSSFSGSSLETNREISRAVAHRQEQDEPGRAQRDRQRHAPGHAARLRPPAR